MKTKLILLLILFSIASLVNNELIAQKNYKGALKHKQLAIEVLPTADAYIFDQKINDTLKNTLDQKVDELFSKYNVAGITATILIPKKGIWETTKGFKSKPDKIPVDEATVFYWGSVSKLITSTIIHQLVIENKLSFDDKLSKWCPKIQKAKKITIEQLLTHTNGLYSFNADSTVHFSNKKFKPDELLAVANSHENLFDPGEYWSYTNTGYLLLALIAEQIESKPFSQIVKDRIAEPLHLKTLRVATEKDPNLALAHTKTSVLHKDYSIPLGAGNVVSNSKDMAVFLSDLLTGKIIPRTTIHHMMTDLYPMYDKGQYYGKGIMLYDFNDINQINNSWIGHSGGTENYKAIIAYDLQTKAIITIAINENISVESVAYKLLELINE